ncbi:hypothetical protein O6H91_04G066600 [Diphasiastrum complanatum]|uniref:Uncharacterized protein n=1 Tax=Diphasiastrum complanatum TaxID=34168 RepID=A0ACC2DXI7_DIPCM|nr:hypothetical protein O6H91_04G066600 [Diphasiastrum complanatum]
MEGNDSPCEALNQNTELKLHKFLHWLEFNGIQLRGCSIKPSEEGSQKGYGVYTSNPDVQGILMVTPLHMAITPMSVLQDPVLGSYYQKLYEDGEVDDRLLVMLFLLVERLRGSSSFWAPYLDMLPVSFGTPLWCSEEELLELKGTALFHATNLQHKSLRALFQEKVKPLVESFLSSVGCFERANCTFWTRALNIPCPHAFVFPTHLPTPPALCFEQEQGLLASSLRKLNYTETPLPPKEYLSIDHCEGNLVLDCGHEEKNPMHAVSSLENQGSKDVDIDHQCERCSNKHCKAIGDINPSEVASLMEESITIWVEGLVPGIDFCNHDPRSLALWEVDGESGYVTGIPFSMYLITAPGAIFSQNKQICISYGNKGNEELFFLYGFTIDDNPDDYLMLHFYEEVLEQDQCFEAKTQLLGDQKLPLRWLLPASLLEKGYYENSENDTSRKQPENLKDHISFSWSGQRTAPCNLQSIVFPEDLMATMRVIAMKEEEVSSAMSLLEQLSHTPSEEDLKAAVWEVCGNSGAFELLINLLKTKMVEMEDASGTEEADADLLKRDGLAQLKLITNETLACVSSTDPCAEIKKLPFSDFQRNCVIYRKGQKHLVQQFLEEAVQGLKFCSD